MAASAPSTNRSGRPRKPSTVASHPPTVNPSNETPTPSAAGGPAPSVPTPIYSSSGPMNVAECEAMAAQLLDPNSPIRRKTDIAAELRDSAETNRDFAFYEKYLAIFIPVLVTILGDESNIIFVKDTTEHRFRHALFSFLHRLPHSEPLKQHTTTILELVIKLLKVENEENALLLVKIIIDAFRNHKVREMFGGEAASSDKLGQSGAFRPAVSGFGEADVSQCQVGSRKGV
jgi:transformation/transcription domain-associated protein